MRACIFCELVAGERETGTVFFPAAQVAAFPAKHQRELNRGHTLVVPVEHHRNLYDLPEGLYTPLLTAVRTVALAVHEAFQADGTTIRLNNEHPGQDVFHAHFHVIPRHADDVQMSTPSSEVTLAERRRQAQLLASQIQPT